MDLNSVVTFLAAFVIGTIFANVFGLLGIHNLPKGPLALPILGSLPFLGESVPKTFMKWWKKYGNVFRVQLGSMNIVVLNGYETIKTAAEADNDTFSGRPDFVSFSIMREVNSGANPLAFCPFSTNYLQLRKYIATTLRKLTNNYSNSFFRETLREEADRLCKITLEKASGGHAITMAKDIEFATSSFIYQLVFGPGKSQEDRDNRVNEWIKVSNDFDSFVSTGNPLDVMPWLRYFLPSKIAKLKRFLLYQVGLEKKHVLDHKEVFSDEILNDVTDYFLKYDLDKANVEHGDEVTKGLFCSLKDLFAAGYSTSSTTLLWMVLYMIYFPNIQEKVHEEIDQVIGDTPNIEITDKRRLHFTMATINEVMRITSILPFGLPHATTRDINFMGFNIEKDIPVNFNLYSVNHEENTWGDPETFRPERLLNEQRKLDELKCRKIASFGFGRRACIGERIARAELFIMFTTLMKRFTFGKPVDEILDLTPDPGLIYKPKQFRVLVKTGCLDKFEKDVNYFTKVHILP